QQVAKYYYENISNPIIELPERLPDENNAYHLFPILVKGKGNRDRLQKYLTDNGIGTVIHYPIPPHKQECYAKGIWNTPQLKLPITERLADEELSLPIGQCVSGDDLIYIVKFVNLFE
ncbi:MAG: DegT/DnrJ/EryC1/StrS family aminotransferase, partial [Bacteroidales bacterium]|nr:DegT/DnrJ/EryC1/StrS family aminotransferase [Bacteroidales bacterium]MDY6427394.1 DegT/DnrJ/EryC1/StrS family aminotransferase [Bacteroidales bacterium]